MGKVIVGNLVSLDGFFAKANDEIDWHVVDDEFHVYQNELLNTANAILLGRVTYQMLASYWPTKTAQDDILADKMNTTPKIVFSTTLDKVDWGTWGNARLVKRDIAQEISTLKRQSDKNMVIYGSGSIVSTLTQLGLVDEYWLWVNPVVLGTGKSLFTGLTKPLNLKLIQSTPFKNAVVLLRYEPETK